MSIKILCVGNIKSNYKDVVLKLSKEKNNNVILPNTEDKKYNFDNYIVKTKKFKKGQ